MIPNPMTLAIIAGAAVLAYVLFARPSKPLPAIRSAPATLRTASPGRQLIDHVHEIGREMAGQELVSKLGTAQGAEFVSLFVKAFGPPPSPPTPPNG